MSIGFKNFEKLLDGAYFMDQHFCESPLEQNVIICVWQFVLLACY